MKIKTFSLLILIVLVILAGFAILFVISSKNFPKEDKTDAKEIIKQNFRNTIENLYVRDDIQGFLDGISDPVYEIGGNQKMNKSYLFKTFTQMSAQQKISSINPNFTRNMDWDNMTVLDYDQGLLQIPELKSYDYFQKGDYLIIVKRKANLAYGNVDSLGAVYRKINGKWLMTALGS